MLFKIILFTVDELSEISKEYNEALFKFDFGKYLRGLVGDLPTAMINPHVHHILFKKGLGQSAFCFCKNIVLNNIKMLK